MKGRFQKNTVIKEYFNFKTGELYPLLLAILAFGFVFSINFPGESFNVISWIWYLFLATIISAISFFGRISAQKYMGLKKGYYVTFKIWWEGVIASIIIALLSFAYLPLILAGGINSSFMVRQRIGRFAYGYSFEENSGIAVWGLWANLILATLFAILLYAYPESFFFEIGLKMNLFMALSMLIPFPRLDGLQIFFGSRAMYGIAWTAFLLTSLLLLSGTKIGLIILVIIGAIAGIISTLWEA